MERTASIASTVLTLRSSSFPLLPFVKDPPPILDFSMEAALGTLAGMYRGKKIVVVMPAYNAARTLRQTYSEVRDQGVVDRIILVDDGSKDDTVAVARS